MKTSKFEIEKLRLERTVYSVQLERLRRKRIDIRQKFAKLYQLETHIQRLSRRLEVTNHI